MSFSHTIELSKGANVILVEGNLMERYEASALLDEVAERIAEGNTRFIIDLKKLNYLNSSGLNVFLNILTRARNAGGDAVICHVSPKLSNLFIITKLDSVFTLAKNRAEAFKRLKGTERSSTHGA